MDKVSKGQLRVSIAANMPTLEPTSDKTNPKMTCPLCNGMEYTFEQRLNQWGKPYEVAVPCCCREAKKSQRQIKASGMDKQFEMYHLADFRADSEPWKTMLAAAKRFLLLADKGILESWFFVGGQSGAGKTHLCAALCKELLLRGFPVRHMLWRADAPRIKALVNDESYGEAIRPFKESQVLYIDDFLKGSITQADINLAFVLLDYRYVRPDHVTIISSELFLPEIMEIDEAIGGRIFERAKHFALLIAREEGSNYRSKSSG